jgi:hypothetical protein
MNNEHQFARLSNASLTNGSLAALWRPSGGPLTAQVLHVWWFFLFMRMAYRLVVGSSAHSAAREEYEGDSDKED